MSDTKIDLKKRSSRTVRREVYVFDEEFGPWETDTWTRRTVNGELDKWIPHDGYGELFESDAAKDKLKQKLESIYQNSGYGYT